MSRRDADQRAPRPARRPLSPIEAALIAEACSRSDLVWLRPVGEARYRAAWHVWHDDAIVLVYGTGEQMLPLLSGEVELIARSKDTGARVVSFVAEASSLPARTPEWDAAAAALSAARLNASDAHPEPGPDGSVGPGQRERWASGGLVTLLRPLYVTAGGVGSDDTPLEAVAPPRGPGTTVTRTPYHLRGRQRRAARMARRNRG